MTQKKPPKKLSNKVCFKKSPKECPTKHLKKYEVQKWFKILDPRSSACNATQGAANLKILGNFRRLTFDLGILRNVTLISV